MQTLKAIIWLMLLAGAASPPLRAQPTENYLFVGNRPLPDGNAAGLSDVRNVNSSIGSISSVKVGLKITGEFNGDLYGYLRHASGFVVLLNRSGKMASNSHGYPDSGFDVSFQHGRTRDIHLYLHISAPPAGAPLIGTWDADGRTADPASVTNASGRFSSLTNFNGLSAAGEWTLYLADLESGGTNALAEWSLEITGDVDPALIWPNPADIVYGTALGDSQLNAIATYSSTNVPGTFSYAPPSGTFLKAGTGQTLSVTFTPADTASFRPRTTSVTVNVAKAPLTITANDTNKLYGASLPAFTARYDGFVNGDTAASLDTTVALGTTATAFSAPGNYAIAARGAAGSNYTITQVDGELTIYATNLQDYLELTVGSTNVEAGESVSIPIQLASDGGVTNLAFTLRWAPAYFANAALVITAAEISSASMRDQVTNLLITMQTGPGFALQGTQQIAEVSLLAMPNRPSAFVQLPVEVVMAANPAGAFYTNYITHAGMIVVVQDVPLLLAGLSANLDRDLTAFGKLGAIYQLQYTTNPIFPGGWSPLLTYTQTNGSMALRVNSDNPTIFYRLFLP
jgi:subtilisin-like proprotein convertase family protein